MTNMERTRRCPICRREIESQAGAAAKWGPFCSARCRSIDLGSWLSEAYRVEATGEGDPEPVELDKGRGSAGE
ncbi:MAG: DNA gyrase inhibitor YacG [Polyangia bacterium]